MPAQDEESLEFRSLVGEITEIGREYHRAALVRNAEYNKNHAGRSLKELASARTGVEPTAMVISAGPSVRARNSIERIRDGYRGTIIATDGAYVACLRAGLVPDYVVCLDPHPKRIVRWFGDPNIEENSRNDDYFERQDLNADFRGDAFRKNAENIALVNAHATKTRAIVATAVHQSVSDRLKEAGFEVFWWNPLVDDPSGADSITRRLFQVNGLPCLNTGGTVGTAAWIFVASILKIPLIGVVGMDFGYHHSTPFQGTQTYFELVDRNGSEQGIEKYFVRYTFPLNGEEYYTDPTYYWYRRNFIDLFEKIPGSETVNCTEGGTLVHPRIPCMQLDDFFELAKSRT